MKALVVGATGETGSRIVQELVDRHVSVRALVRDPQKAISLFASDVEIVQGDLRDPASIKSALQGCTVVLSAAGARPSWDPTGPLTVDYFGTQTLIDAAQQIGIQHFVLVTSLCVSQWFHPLNLFWLILIWKKQAEDHLRRSGLTYTIVRPGGLRNEDNADPVVMKGEDSLFEGSIPRAKVAKVAVEALFQPAARNKIVEIVAQPTAPEQDLAVQFANVG